MTPFVVMVTGVGSLVGKGILDALEGRRDGLRLVGTTFEAESANAFRCDEAHLTVPSDHADFPDELRRLVDAVRPDLVIPGRDPDVAVVAELPVASLTGALSAVEVCWDKWRTAEFAVRHGLAAIPTVQPGTADFGPPAVFKPRTGSGSVGVQFLLTETAWNRANDANYAATHILQPLIGPEPPMIDPDEGIPLFYSGQLVRQGGVQGVIDPHGEVGIAAAFETTLQFGWVRNQWLVDEPELLAVGTRWLRALASAGWRGPLNVSCAYDGASWLLMELNPRFTGGTAARTMCGFDEVGWAINRWAGREVVPPLSEAPHADLVMRDMAEYPVRTDDVTALQRGVWRRDPQP